MTNSSIVVNSLPVFVQPTSLYFYTDDLNSHKQIITVYNPYEFPIKFKIVCSKADKYTIPDSEGIIRAKCCVDLVVRHIDVTYMNENVTDKLRIQIYSFNNSNSSTAKSNINAIGKQDLSMTLLSSRPAHSNQDQSLVNSNYGNSLNSMLGVNATTTTNKHNNLAATTSSTLNQSNRNNPETVSYAVIFIGIACICMLCLPTIGDDNQFIPKYLHLSFEIKLFTAFILGMVTMAILRY